MGGSYFSHLPLCLASSTHGVVHNLGSCICVFSIRGRGKFGGFEWVALAALEWLARLVFGRRKHIAFSLLRRHETERLYVLKFEDFTDFDQHRDYYA